MKNIIAICLTTFILLSQANGNIVDQLTELNNLYKSGAINEDEFNYTTNPTIITGSQIPTVFSGSNIDWENTASIGTPLGFATSSYFTPYITTVGLYDDNFNLHLNYKKYINNN